MMASALLRIRGLASGSQGQSILEEHDGPMLRHGLQGMHNQRI
jgi:hypothetical protein